MPQQMAGTVSLPVLDTRIAIALAATTATESHSSFVIPLTLMTHSAATWIHFLFFGIHQQQHHENYTSIINTINQKSTVQCPVAAMPTNSYSNRSWKGMSLEYQSRKHWGNLLLSSTGKWLSSIQAASDCSPCCDSEAVYHQHQLQKPQFSQHRQVFGVPFLFPLIRF